MRRGGNWPAKHDFAIDVHHYCKRCNPLPVRSESLRISSKQRERDDYKIKYYYLDGPTLVVCNSQPNNKAKLSMLTHCWLAKVDLTGRVSRSKTSKLGSRGYPQNSRRRGSSVGWLNFQRQPWPYPRSAQQDELCLCLAFFTSHGVLPNHHNQP